MGLLTAQLAHPWLPPSRLLQEVHAHVRAWVAKNVNAEVADKLRILYGGSGACPLLIANCKLLAAVVACFASAAALVSIACPPPLCTCPCTCPTPSTLPSLPQ